MFYFNSFPKISTIDYNKNTIVLTNILKRIELIPSLLKNPLLFYQYDIQEGDTPDIVANKYYGNSYRYWLPLLANQTIDPQWDWPLTSSQFDNYIKDKYGSVATATGTVKEYRQITTTVDSHTLEETSKTIVVDETTYNAITPSISSATFPNGATVTQTISKSAISVYDYELEQNEAKRTINLINSIYTAEIESQFKSLMGV
jgi:hypothetical protein